MPENPRVVPYLILMIPIVCWGGSFVATRYAVAYGGFGVFTLLAVRFLLATAILIPVLWIRSRSPRNFSSRRLSIGKLIGIAIIFPGLYYFFETTGIANTSASLASLIIASIPVITGIISSVFLKEKIGTLGWIGVVLSVIGVCAIVYIDAEAKANGSAVSENAATLVGTASIVVAAVLGAVYMVFTRLVLSTYHPFTLTSTQTIFGLLFYLPFAIIELKNNGWPVINPGGVLSALFLGVFASVVSFFAFNKALQQIEATRASIFVNIIPLVSIFFAWIFLDEKLSAGHLISGTVIIAGVAIGTIRSQ